MSLDVSEDFSFPAADRPVQSEVTPLTETNIDLDTFQNVLILMPDGEPAEEHACEFLSCDRTPATHHLRIGEGTIGQVQQRWAERNQEIPANIYLFSTNPDVNDYPETTHEIRAISEGDLSGTGIAVSRVMDSIPSSEQTTLCFNNLTTFCIQNENKAIFRFLHLLTSRIKKQQIKAHYHLDPTHFSNQQLATLFDVFDIIITYNDRWLFKYPD